jgi:hypothetical protein
MTTTTTTTINNQNGDLFTIGSYNGFNLTIHDKTGYVNASKLCDDISSTECIERRFRDFKSRGKWKNIKEIWVRVETSTPNSEPIYQLNKGYDNDFKGFYVHPDLIHYVAEWASLKNAFKVGIIMNLLNQRNQITQETLDDYTHSLRNEVEQLKIEHKDYVDTHQPRLCPKDKEIYCIMLYTEEITLEKHEVHAVRRMKKYFDKELKDIHNSPKCLFYKETLPVSTSIFHVFADKLEAKGIKSNNLRFIIDTVEQYDIVIETINEVIDEMKI